MRELLDTRSTITAQEATIKGLREAGLKFAEAWAAWHEHSGLMLDDELIAASNGILDAMGLEMDEDDETGKYNLFPIAKTPTTEASKPKDGSAE